MLTMKVKNAINFRNNWNFRETGDYELRNVAFENDDHIDRNSRWGRTSFENGFLGLWQSLSFLCFSSTSISTSTLYLYLLFSGRFVVLNSVQSMPFQGAHQFLGDSFQLIWDRIRPGHVPSRPSSDKQLKLIRISSSTRLNQLGVWQMTRRMMLSMIPMTIMLMIKYNLLHNKISIQLFCHFHDRSHMITCWRFAAGSDPFFCNPFEVNKLSFLFR